MSHARCLVCKMAGKVKYPSLCVMGTRCRTEREKYFTAINVTLTLEGFAAHETTSPSRFSAYLHTVEVDRVRNDFPILKAKARGLPRGSQTHASGEGRAGKKVSWNSFVYESVVLSDAKYIFVCACVCMCMCVRVANTACLLLPFRNLKYMRCDEMYAAVWGHG